VSNASKGQRRTQEVGFRRARTTPAGGVRDRATIVQQKTVCPVQFEITEQTRASVQDEAPPFDAVTRNEKPKATTIEKLTFDCLDVPDLQKRGLFTDDWLIFRPMLGWPGIKQMRVAKFVIYLDLRGHTEPQRIRVSWTKPHYGGERPWMHCPHCDRRVAKLYNGLGGYFCRPCVGNPLYASQALSSQSRAHFQACKLRLQLGGDADLTAPIPLRPRRMHQRTYKRLKDRLLTLEAGLSPRTRSKSPDYPNLVAYFQ
jgi:hypothetical protein